MHTKIKSHSFELEDAMKYGVEASVLLQNIRYWVDKNMANETNVRDGYCWTFNSAKAYTKQFPYWSRKKIWNLLVFLEKEGVIKSANYNKKGYDRTKWYTIVHFGKMDVTKTDNRDSKNGTPIPDINTDINTDVKDTSPEYLLNLSESEIKYLNRTYKATSVEIANKAESLYNWCQANGRKYKMYRPFLKNALERDFGKRIIRNNPATL